MSQVPAQVKAITPKSQDFSQWYVDVVVKAELMDYAPVKGCMVLRPYGFSIWERIQESLDSRFKKTGHQNAYFPIFIPESFLKKEAEHVEGFAPEVAWVTHGGQEELAERLAVRPTSETIICAMYSKWIQSWRDLPVLINQWCNVVRWEKATRPFLRTTEFLWQEGHTAHATYEEAQEEALKMLFVYEEFLRQDLAVPVVVGRKTESEKFAGALETYTLEALMSDGKALQAGTSHNLGQRFAKAFNITFLDKDGKLKYVWQTSWGVSTRLIGALIMVHGDDKGLVLPPRLAPIQAVIVPIVQSDSYEAVMGKAAELEKRLCNLCRVKLDNRPEYTPGWKFNEWEMRGVPLRLEVGPRDIAKNQVTISRRDTGIRVTVPDDRVEALVPSMLEEVQNSLFNRAKSFLDSSTHKPSSYKEFKEIVSESRGFLVTGWCGKQLCELAIKEETGATIRCIPFEDLHRADKCIYCGQDAKLTVYFARAY